MSDSKKHILLVVRWPVGGIRTFLRYVYRGFDPVQWQFTIIAPDLDEMRVLINEDLAEIKIVYRPVEKNPSALTFARSVFKELRCNKYDLVHSHGFTSGACAAVPAKLTGIKHLMTSHDVINANQFAGIKGQLKKASMRFVFERIDKIHSVSHDAQSNLLEYFPHLARHSGKCVVIPNGIEVERFLNADPRDLRGELGLADDCFLIGFFGRFMSQKGFLYLVDAVELLSKRDDLPKKPLILTFGSGGFAEREKRDIKARGLEGYFHHMPFTANVAGSMKGLDVVVMPSLWEACGLLAMESLVCGVPLIATKCLGIREFLQEAPVDLIDLKSSEAICGQIVKEQFHSRKSKYQEFIPIAASRYNVNIQIKKLRSLYYELLG